MAKNTELSDCDVVMKGGITSGVVYPSAILALASSHRFRSIGGASVGAIAAALTAAAEYGRQMGSGTGFRQLEAMNEEVASHEGYLLDLFKPRPEARGLFSVYLAALGRKGPLRTMGAVLAQSVWCLFVLSAWWALLGYAAALLGNDWWIVPASLFASGLFFCGLAWVLGRRISSLGLAGLILPALWPVLVGVLSLGARGWRDLSENGFGLVAGSTSAGDGVCDWLHEHIQTAAGLPPEEPLTFGMLNRAGVELQMTTTDLSVARPLRVPDQLEGFAYDPREMEGVLPRPVLEWLEGDGSRVDDGLIRLPTPKELPVILGFRLSLSFPLLFTAVPLHGSPLDRDASGWVRHWFSDGGIASNFPIHLFDAWIPTRPTFALSFAPFPQDEKGRRRPDADEVGVPGGPTDPTLPRWSATPNLAGFFRQIFDTMQNWRDTVQAEVPGFADRVYETRLDNEAGEGGLNLGMDVETIRRLQRRGALVGTKIERTFDWDQHWFTRYLLVSQQLELNTLGSEGLGLPVNRTGISASFDVRKDALARGDIGAHELFGHDAAWLPEAGKATERLLAEVRSWESFGRFLNADHPRPLPAMRIVPDL